MSTEQHHHRSTTKVSQKSFKSRHATKNALKERLKGKIEKGARKTPQQHVLSKLERRNQAKQKRINSNVHHTRTTSIFAGKDGAPRIVAVVPLCENASPKEAVRVLNEAVDVEVEENLLEVGKPKRLHIERFKQNITYTVVQRDILAVLDACRVADFVLFVLSATEEVDSLGEMLIKAVESQGISNVLAVALHLDTVEQQKKRSQTLTSLKSFITHYLPSIEKVNSLESRQDCQNVVRVLCTTTPKGIRWREDRSWMMVEDVRWPSGKSASTGTEETGEVVLTGVIRGRGLKADRLVHVGDWGTFQVSSITAAPLEGRKKMRGDDMAVDTEGNDAILSEPTEDQDDLIDLAPEEVLMDDFDTMRPSIAASERKGVLLDNHHYFDDEETDITETKARRLPRGTSKYQSAWYLEDLSDSGSDLEDVDFDGEEFDYPESVKYPVDNNEDINMREPTEDGPSEYPQSEMFLDPSPEDEAEQIAAYRSQRQEEASEDREFPDEIELNPNVLARERLARYRGLKSLRTSKWETDEDKLHEPVEWRRLLEIADYKGARNRVIKDTLVGGVQPGTRVHVHLRGVPVSLQNSHNSSRPMGMFSLLQHEHKKTAANFSITLSSDVTAPVKSKEEIIMQCGPRRFVINPLFSQLGNTANDVHKFERYIHPGQAAQASFIGPLTWGYVPTLFFRRTLASETETENQSNTVLTLIGTGTSLPPSQNRVIAKRIILTGHPFKIHKRLVTIRYMFFNSEDVAWYKALQLWTRRGRSGNIKASLGTHGYFKAMFDGKINPMDAVAVSLYKRVWPRSATAWKGGEEVPQLIDRT